MKEKALKLFTAVPKLHNCAQAVACGAERDDLKDELSKCGGGKAPGGLCGALYSALLLSPAEKHDKIKRDFAAKAGFLNCSEIKTISKFPCADCVTLGAELLEKSVK